MASRGWGGARPNDSKFAPGLPLPAPCPQTHLCFQKFCRYFDVEERYVDCEEGRYVATAELMRPLIDENTIGERTLQGAICLPGMH